jgi:N-acetylglucosaminyldiphosphoundecaprenol N-acetyl-beta-D-mannosaminyltransferase
MTPLTNESILGYDIAAASADDCFAQIEEWLRRGDRRRFVACANPHSLMRSEKDKVFSEALHAADLLVPDGIGVVLASRFRKGRIARRITGSDLFRELNLILQRGGGASAFLLGSTDTVLHAMKTRMQREFPLVRVVGTFSPPFKPEFTCEDEDVMVEAVNRVRPDVLWLGMTAPKQEKLLHRMRERLDVGVALAVGAVFDFYAGTIPRPNALVQRLGLEWLGRLMREPRRLWRRNLDSLGFLLRILAKGADEEDVSWKKS